MKTLINNCKNQLEDTALARLNIKDIFNNDQINRIQYLMDIVPKERILIGDVGDDNCLLVGRYMQDIKNNVPIIENGSIGSEMIDILNNDKSKIFFDSLLGKPSYIRRCQVNSLTEGCHIGTHVDTYSNMDYIYSIVLQFGKEYEGGEFYVHYKNQEETVKTGFGEMLINKCEIPHGVKKVTSGFRKTLVFFISDSPLEVSNHRNHQI